LYFAFLNMLRSRESSPCIPTMAHDEDDRDLFSDMGTYHAVCLARARSKDPSDRSLEWRHVPRSTGLVRLRHGAVIPREMRLEEIGRVHVARPLTKDSLTFRSSPELKVKVLPRPSTAPAGGAARKAPVDDLAGMICTLDRESLRSLIGALETKLQEVENSGQASRRSRSTVGGAAAAARPSVMAKNNSKQPQIRINGNRSSAAANGSRSGEAANGTWSNRSNLATLRSQQLSDNHHSESFRTHRALSKGMPSESQKTTSRSGANAESSRSVDPRKETLVRFLQTVFKPER